MLGWRLLVWYQTTCGVPHGLRECTKHSKLTLGCPTFSSRQRSISCSYLTSCAQSNSNTSSECLCQAHLLLRTASTSDHCAPRREARAGRGPFCEPRAPRALRCPLPEWISQKAMPKADVRSISKNLRGTSTPAGPLHLRFLGSGQGLSPQAAVKPHTQPFKSAGAISHSFSSDDACPLLCSLKMLLHETPSYKSGSHVLDGSLRIHATSVASPATLHGRVHELLGRLASGDPNCSLGVRCKN